MKRKVGELFNKPIVQGNENVLSSNEILVEQKGNTFSLKERVSGEIKEISGSGGGSGTPLSKDMIYLDMSGYTVDDKTAITNSGVALCAKYIDDNGSVSFVSPLAFALTDRSIWKKMNYYAICGSLLVRDYEGNIVSLIDAANLRFPDIPRITEEEFYTL